MDIISADKYAEEEFIKKIADEGTVQVLHDVFSDPTEKSPETYQIAMTLIKLFAGCRSVLPLLIEKGLLDDLVKLAQNHKFNENVTNEALEAIMKITSINIFSFPND